MLRISEKYCKRVAPEVQISGQNSKFWQFCGLYSHIFAPINVKVGTGERTSGPLPRANFHVYRGNVSPLRGEKPIFRPVSKNNTGMAALRADLPVIILSHHCHHLEIVYDVIILPRVAWFEQNLVAWCGVARRSLWYGQNGNWKKNSNMTDVYFSKPEEVISQQ